MGLLDDLKSKRQDCEVDKVCFQFLCLLIPGPFSLPRERHRVVFPSSGSLVARVGLGPHPLISPILITTFLCPKLPSVQMLLEEGCSAVKELVRFLDFPCLR